LRLDCGKHALVQIGGEECLVQPDLKGGVQLHLTVFEELIGGREGRGGWAGEPVDQHPGDEQRRNCRSVQLSADPLAFSKDTREGVVGQDIVEPFWINIQHMRDNGSTVVSGHYNYPLF
jgi:hypothetical protein